MLKIDSTVLEILSSRICHDLISPIGAIHNGLELLEDMGVDSGNEALELVGHSAKQASAKLQIFRIVYGAGGKDPQIKPDDIHKAMDAMLAEGKSKQDWSPASLNTTDMPVGFCKMLMGALLLAHECLPKGGVIKVMQADPKSIIVTAEGPDAAPRAQVTEAIALTIDPATLDPRLVHPYVIGILAKQYGYRIAFSPSSPGKVAIGLSAA